MGSNIQEREERGKNEKYKIRKRQNTVLGPFPGNINLHCSVSCPSRSDLSLRTIIMSYSRIPIRSMTAMKYQRYGCVEEKPFLPGERYSVSRDMERTVRGYKEVSVGLKEAREMIAQQDRQRRSMETDRPPMTSFYKSPVGCRSTKGSGAIFYSNPVPREYFFSGGITAYEIITKEEEEEEEIRKRMRRRRRKGGEGERE